MTTTPTQHTAREQIYSYVRARVAFEQMVLSVFYGTLISAGIVFLLRVGSGLLAPNFSAAALLGEIPETLTYAFVVFLTGFLAAVVIGVPLFQILEKRKFRKAWPYFAAALFVVLAFCLLALGAIPDFVRSPIVVSVSLIAPGFIVAALFTRRMRPVWRQAEAAEKQSVPVVVRLH